MESPLLLVTDDAALAPAVSDALKTRELTVVPCEPARCITMAAQIAPSLVLLDLEIRTVAWNTVLTAILAEARTRGIPVVGITRTPGAELVLPVVAGMHDVLTLPLDGARLEQLVGLLLSLGFQFGTGASEAGAAAADRLLLYAERNGVSGTLERGPVSAPTGQAVFSLGFLASSRFARETGRAGLAALLAAPGEIRFAAHTKAPRGAMTPPAPAPAPEVIDAGALEVIEPIPAAPVPEEKTTVLAVDDDADMVALVAAFLGKEGFDVRTASDGEDGFSTAVAMRPDAIVSDLEMPRLDGWGLLRKIRADHRIADTPLLFLSAAEDFRMSVQASAAGAQDYLSKGGARDVLAARLRGALQPRRELEGAMRTMRHARSRVELTGARWTLLRFAALAARGCVIVADGVGVHEVAFENGDLRSADATIGDKVLSGAKALEAFLSVRSGDLVMAHATRRPVNFSGPVEETVEAACVRNNAIESLAITRALASRDGVVVDPDLCDLYARFGPPAGRVIAAGLRSGKAPLDLLSSANNPVEVEHVLRDLARRRVILVPST